MSPFSKFFLMTMTQDSRVTNQDMTENDSEALRLCESLSRRYCV